MTSETGIINIRGKQYHTVPKRVQDFRERHKDYGIITEVESRDGPIVVMKATITDETGRVIATGHAEEDRTNGQINRTSALENAETSAIGRALAAFGIGGTEFASANEVENAIHQDESPLVTDAQRDEIAAMAQAANVTLKTICEAANVDSLKDLPAAKFASVISKLKATIAKNQKETV